MKKWIASLLALIMVLSLAACDLTAPTTKPNNTDPTTTGSTPAHTEPTHTTRPTEPAPTQPPELTAAEKILAAVQRTRSAKSFMVQFGSITEVLGEKEEEFATAYMMIDESGSMTGLVTEPFEVWETGEIIDRALYINGNVGYELDPYLELYGEFGYYKHTSSTGFGPETLFADIEGFIENPDFLADFCASELTAETLENGDTRYQVANASILDLVTLLGAELSEGEEPSIDGMPIENMTVTLDLTATGYLSKLAYTIHVYMAELDMRMTMELFVDIDRHDETLDIQAPEFVAERENGKGWNQYHIHENGYEAVYQVESENEETFCVFEGMENDYDSTQVIPVYKVLKEVDGLPVKYVQDVSTNLFQNTAYIEKLILPEGVAYRGWTDREHTQLFFESEKGSVENHFYVIGEEENHYAGIKAAYYAGEWEYVDDVPVPKQ